MSFLIRLNPTPSPAERMQEQRFRERLQRDRLLAWLDSDESVVSVSMFLHLFVTPVALAFAADVDSLNGYLIFFAGWLVTSILHVPFLVWIYLPLGWGVVALLRWRMRNFG